MSAKSAPPLFAGITYHLASCLLPDDQSKLKNLLDSNGATEVASICDASYIFTDSENFVGSSEVNETAAVVLPQWILRSLSNKVKQDPKYFSPSPRATFASLVITTDHLPPGDVEAIISGVNLRGGMYREGLTRDITHLLVLSPTGDKYTTARRYASQTNIKILVPHWLDDCIKLKALLPTEPYEQLLLKAEEDFRNEDSQHRDWDARSVGSIRRSKLRPKASEKKRLIYASMARAATPPRQSISGPGLSPPSNIVLSSSQTRIGPSSSPNKRSSSPSKALRKEYANAPPLVLPVWAGRRVLLSHSLLLSSDRRATVEIEVERSGGHVVRLPAKRRGQVDTSEAGEGSALEDDEEQDELDSDDEEVDEEVQWDVAYAEQRASGHGDALRLSDKYLRKEAQEALFVMSGEVDVLVTKYRSGLAYMAALRCSIEDNRTILIGTLPWLYFCHSTGSIAPPTDQLIHFPVRRGFVEGIRGKQITISNYHGHDREYLKKLITVMGGPLPPKASDVFTATLTKNTDVVIAGRLEGQKVEKAQSWHLPVVNHLWLEDSFKGWRFANLADPAYNHYSKQISYTEIYRKTHIYSSKKPQDVIAFVQSELDILGKEMPSIGYDLRHIEDILYIRVEGLRRFVDPLWSAALSASEQEPTASLLQVERDLVGDDDVMGYDDPLPSARLPGPSSRRSGKASQDSVAEKNRKSSSPTKIGYKHSEAQSEVAREIMDYFSEDLNRSHSGNGGLNRNIKSPYSPSKLSKPLVTNDTPPQLAKKSPVKKLAREQERQQHEAPEWMQIGKESRKDEADRAAGPKSRLHSSHSPSIESRRPPPSSRSSPSPSNEDAGAVEVPRSPRKAKRDIRTQESDEEFKIESQGNLMSRRAKVVDKGQPSEVNAISEVKKKNRHSSVLHQDEDSSNEEEWSDAKGKKPSKKVDKVMRKLRDSISGKEDKTPKKGRRQEQEDEDVDMVPMEKRRRKNRTKSRDTAASDMDASEESNAEEPVQRRKFLKRPTKASTSSGASAEKNATHKNQGETTLGSDDEQNESGVRARRGAATKATQLLHDKIMPDVNRFANEVRSGNIRGDWEEKKRKREDIAANEEEERKRRRRSVGAETHSSKASTLKSTDIPKTGIRMIHTKVQLTEGDFEKLRRMGIQLVTEPNNCTHLVSNSILRTPKFLCALSVAPLVVNEQWLRACIAQSRVLDESSYLLEDKEGEKRIGTSLRKSLRRAKENGGRLFEGHSFYLSPNHPVELIETLRKVITSAAGKCSTQLPNARQLENHPERHFIGAAGDSEKFKAFVERSIPIYCLDTVIYAVLRQELPDWDSEEYRLE